MPTSELWNYDRTKIGQAGRDKARYELGDTGIIQNQEGNKVWLLYDEEIDAMIGAVDGGDPTRYEIGTAELAEGLAVRFAQSAEVYTGPGGDRVEWKSRVAQWNAVAVRMRGKVQPVAERDPGLTVVAGMAEPSGLFGLVPFGGSYVRYP